MINLSKSTIDAESILKQYYDPDSLAYKILWTHSSLVTQKAVEIAERVSHLKPDLTFIREAAMLHDIGICKTNAADIGCNGRLPYIFHGIKGREILENAGLKPHGLVAERHILTGISAQDIIEKKLGLPDRDMIPLSIEEVIICYADNFFSKKPDTYKNEKSFEDILKLLGKYGKEQVDTFLFWAALFGD